MFETSPSKHMCKATPRTCVWKKEILEKYGKRIRRLEDKAFNSFFKMGNLVRKARIEKGLSQHELAFKVGMRQSDISKIEKGEKNITMVTLFRLCRVLDIKRIELY